MGIATPVAVSDLRKLVGNYWNGVENNYRRVVLKQGSLWLDWGEGTGGQALVPEGATRFRVLNTRSHVEFRDEQMMMRTDGESYASQFLRYDPTPPKTIEDLQGFVGEFFSDELLTTYSLRIEAGRFLLRINNNPARVLFPPPAKNPPTWNSKTRVWIGLGEITFHTDSQGLTDSLSIGDSRVTAVTFRRVFRVTR
jgi:hypothetical protein